MMYKAVQNQQILHDKLISVHLPKHNQIQLKVASTLLLVYVFGVWTDSIPIDTILYVVL